MKILCLVLAFSAVPASAGQVTLSASTSGTWTTSSTNVNGNQTYIAGRGAATNYANFFVFDLSGVAGTIMSATFIVNALGVNSSGLYTVYDVSTPIASLVLVGNNPNTAIYNDLSSGIAYGSANIAPANQDQFVSIALNAAAIAALQSRAGVGSAALGGGYDAATQFGTAFASGGFPPEQSNLNQLVLEVNDVPEPGSQAMAGLALIAFGIASRLRR